MLAFDDFAITFETGDMIINYENKLELLLYRVSRNHCALF